MKLLRLDSSALGANSVTRELTAAVVDQQRRLDPALEVVHRDLDTDALPHLSAATFANDEATAQSAAVLDEFLAADTVVIGAPMYNFSIPSTLKAWIDRVSVAGKTFRYGANGPEGLVHGKTVIVAVASGGAHAGQPTDFVEPYLRQLFGFLGVPDVRFIRADGVAFSPEHRRNAIDAAVASLDVELPQAA
ncbi:FMN-dependent NADH-azoreductase [Lysobacter sp. TY2-98]|uniref:FMN-dependent NADH-azoreductase n=1 Tax=Lysobacter sp. TY2-98 TaxID=2290922 RepID=UPI000E20C2AB|nr:NAD(P)H-dependent oxidoreductase [Lysobacter sp. TY2-98]AXK71687.1 FMN-dependent NADH-azoreductase [Lysobacter sp. TY2-98]